LEKIFGASIHKLMAKEYSNRDQGSRRTELSNANFDENETIVILYSHLAGENLAWLYRIGGINVSDQRVDEGMELIKYDNVLSVFIGAARETLSVMCTC